MNLAVGVLAPRTRCRATPARAAASVAPRSQLSGGGHGGKQSQRPPSPGQQPVAISRRVGRPITCGEYRVKDRDGYCRRRAANSKHEIEFEMKKEAAGLPFEFRASNFGVFSRPGCLPPVFPRTSRCPLSLQRLHAPHGFFHGCSGFRPDRTSPRPLARAATAFARASRGRADTGLSRKARRAVFRGDLSEPAVAEVGDNTWDVVAH